MVRITGCMRRVERHLEAEETVFASLGGREADGRRRCVVVLTDRRVLIAWLRGGPPEELPLSGSTVCRYEQPGSLLTLRQGDHEVLLRDVEEGAARVLMQLLRHRRPPKPNGPSSIVNGVRVVGE